MVTRQNLIYSQSAAARILGIFYGQSRIHIQEWFSVVWVWVEGHRPRFMSKSAFKKHFVEWRKAAARALTVTKHVFEKNKFTVRNESKGSSYTVEAGSDRLTCQCEDYRNQEEFLTGQRRCCKHGYAVLGHLGFSSLANYINAMTGYLRDPVVAGREQPTKFRGVSID